MPKREQPLTISRREFLTAVSAGAATLAISQCPGVASLARPAASRGPNVVLILVADLGYAELGCYGDAMPQPPAAWHGRPAQVRTGGTAVPRLRGGLRPQRVPTPFIDELANSGVRFTDGYAAAPLPGPARAGLLTGRYPQRFGCEFNPADRGQIVLPPTERTLAQDLQAAGYATGMVGESQPGGGQPAAGCSPADPAAIRAREASAFIRRHRDEPFFLCLTFNAARVPLAPPARYLERFAHIRDTKRRTFAATLADLDDSVGLVVRELERLGLRDDTLLFFLSDNGGPTRQTTASNWPLCGYKSQVLEGGIRVPFIVSWPRRIPRGVIRQPVISLDIRPTVLAAVRGAGNLPMSPTDGVDLLPLLGGRAGAVQRTFHWRISPQEAVRCGDWKMVRTGRPGDRDRLFDLARDIGERHDLGESQPDILQRLQEDHAVWAAGVVRESLPRGLRGDALPFAPTSSGLRVAAKR